MAELKITAANFENEVLHSDKPVLLDFYADWCGPCKMLSPVLHELAEEKSGALKVGKVNVDEQMELAIALDGKKKPDWYGRLGVLYERCGQRKNACEAYRQAINAGGSREFYFRLGSCLEKMGEYQEACKAYIQSQDYAAIPFSSIKNLKKKLARADFNPYLSLIHI